MPQNSTTIDHMFEQVMKQKAELLAKLEKEKDQLIGRITIMYGEAEHRWQSHLDLRDRLINEVDRVDTFIGKDVGDMFYRLKKLEDRFQQQEKYSLDENRAIKAIADFLGISFDRKHVPSPGVLHKNGMIPAPTVETIVAIKNTNHKSKK